MNVGGLRWGRPSPEGIQRLLAAARGATPTYAPVGRTLDPAVPTGGPMRERHLDVGRGRADFDAACDALRRWAPQRSIGATVEPVGQPPELGTTILVVLRAGPVFVVAPNRVVAVVDEPGRFGFAYGTLPTHPERGEESFLIELRPDGVVRFTIRVESGAGTLAAKAVAPIVRRLQEAALRKYLRAVVPSA